MAKKVKTASEPEIVEGLRARIGYRTNQTELAKELGISRSYLNEVLHGKKHLGAEVLKKLGYDPTPHYRKD
jgi:antitoxin component HigA of HigAB toxin-antitoxin module